MKHLILVAVAALFILAGCSKDQAVVKQLDGEWKVTSLTYNGQSAPAEDYAGETYTFNKCKVAKEDCDGEAKFVDTQTGLTQTVPFTYSIIDGGEKMIMKVNYFGFNSVEELDILAHSKTTFRFSRVETDDNGVKTTVIRTLTKV